MDAEERCEGQPGAAQDLDPEIGQPRPGPHQGRGPPTPGQRAVGGMPTWSQTRVRRVATVIFDGVGAAAATAWRYLSTKVLLPKIRSSPW